MNWTVWLLIAHGLVAVAVLGALTHQSAALLLAAPRDRRSFTARYASVAGPVFTTFVAATFAADVVLGGIIYPAYRVDVRIPLEEMGLHWVAGTFEIKEHFAGIGLGLLPAYVAAWRTQDAAPLARGARLAVTLPLAFIVWWNFVAGHVINNIRGLE